MTDAETRRDGAERRGRRPLPDHRSQSRRRHVSRRPIPRRRRPLRHRLGFQCADRRPGRVAAARIFAAPAAPRAQRAAPRRRLDRPRAVRRSACAAAPALGGRPAGIASGGAASFVSLDSCASDACRQDRRRHPRRLDLRQRHTGRLRLGRRQQAGRGAAATSTATPSRNGSKGHDRADATDGDLRDDDAAERRSGHAGAVVAAPAHPRRHQPSGSFPATGRPATASRSSTSLRPNIAARA